MPADSPSNADPLAWQRLADAGGADNPYAAAARTAAENLARLPRPADPALEPAHVFRPERWQAT